MSDIVRFRPVNAGDNADHVLEQAIGEYEDVALIGWNKDGTFDFRSSKLRMDELFWIISLCQHKIMNGDYFTE